MQIKNILFYLIVQFSFIAYGNSDATTSVPPEKSLSWLINGNERFLTGHLRKDGQSHADIERLSTGQKPHSIILSCSDSRVPPEVIFDQKLGELFTVRTAGEALDHNVIGSIEYAIEHLGARLVVVLGHTSCGAVKAAMGSLDGSSVGTPSLDVLVKDIHPRLMEYKSSKPSSNFTQESMANAKGVAADLLRRSDLIKKEWAEGKIWLVYGLYNLETGSVVFYNNLMGTPAPNRGLSSVEHH